jgi:ribosomal protein S1
MVTIDTSTIPVIKEGQKITGIVRKKTASGVLLDCADGMFSGVILSKEVKNLEKNELDLTVGTTLEVEIVDPNIRSEDGFYIVSVSQLLQRDIWADVMQKFSDETVFTVRPTEANLGGLLVDMYGIK